jgi:hypothetical protein
MMDIGIWVIKGIEMATDFIRNRRPGCRNIEAMGYEHSRVSNGRKAESSG